MKRNVNHGVGGDGGIRIGICSYCLFKITKNWKIKLNSSNYTPKTNQCRKIITRIQQPFDLPKSDFPPVTIYMYATNIAHYTPSTCIQHGWSSHFPKDYLYEITGKSSTLDSAMNR